MSNPFDADPNVAKYIPGLESSSTWLRNQFKQPGNIQQHIPGLLPAAGVVRGAFQQPANIQNNIPGLIPAANALRGVFGVGPHQTTQKPQKPQKSGNITRVGGKTYNMDDPAQVEALNKVLADNQAALGNPKFADLRGGGGEKPDGTGRFSTRTSPTGVVQTGTQTGIAPMTMDDANSLLARTTNGYQVQNPFASNQLPTTATDAYGTNGYQAPSAENIPENIYNVRPKTMGKNLDMDLGPFDLSQGPKDYASGVQLQSQMLRGSPNIANGGAAETAVVAQSEGSEKNSGTNWGARTAADNSDANLARRRAFLDADSSLGGLRAIEAQKGIVVAGGKYNMVNPNAGQEGENDFMEISKADRDAYMGGRQSAQDLKNKYVDKITAANAGQDASAMTPTDTLQQTDIAFESPAPMNPMKTALEDAPTNQEAPPEYVPDTVQIRTKGKKFGF